MFESKKPSLQDRKGKEQFPQKTWARPWQEVVKELRVAPPQGLEPKEISARRLSFGPNSLREVKPPNLWSIVANQFKNLIVFFLVAAALLSLAFGEYVEGSAIIVVILINAFIGFVTELKGVRSVEALRRLGSVHSRVRRGGRLQEITADELLPGDIVILEGGDIITADLRIINGSKLEADESVLTGESLPVGKNSVAVREDVPLADRYNMLYKGTALTRGSGEAVVVGTGMHTELGTISALVDETEDSVTPLEQSLNQLGHWLVWVCLVIAVLVAVSGILSGKDTFLMIETAIALAVSAIPEGLPIVATIALARGIWRMARHNALVKELSAVETLGATSVICTDKTGTLTENRLTLTELLFAGGGIMVGSGSNGPFTRDDSIVTPLDYPPLRRALEVVTLCNNASYSGQMAGYISHGVGDPLEIALLAAASKAGLDKSALEKLFPEEREEAFDSTIKMMATFNRLKSGYLISVKGAPESVINACASVFGDQGTEPLTNDKKKEWLDANDRLAAQGMRILALAVKEEVALDADPYVNLQLIGLAGFLDPPREDVKEALRLCRQAGVKVVMMTGDQAVTARIIGHAVGLVDDVDAPVIVGGDLRSLKLMSEADKAAVVTTPLFARVSPEQKLDLIDIHQQAGAIVAMTGDGVNDAPAIKKADIGIAMGLRGTQVAREAADMILKDDAFATIVYAIEQGRIIFNNIRKFVLYLLSCNLSEIMTVTFAAVLNLPLPILPLQILFLNIVTDVFPALALAAGDSNPGIMDVPPRPRNEPIMARDHWGLVMIYGLLITIGTLGALILAQSWLGMETPQAISISFLTLAFAQLWHVFNMRSPKSSLLNNVITRNPFIWGALVLCSLMLVATVYLPGLSGVLKVENPGARGWLLVVGMSLFPVFAGLLINALMRIRNKLLIY